MVKIPSLIIAKKKCWLKIPQIIFISFFTFHIICRVFSIVQHPAQYNPFHWNTFMLCLYLYIYYIFCMIHFLFYLFGLFTQLSAILHVILLFSPQLIWLSTMKLIDNKLYWGRSFVCEMFAKGFWGQLVQ